MASFNIELRKNDGSAFADVYYPKTTWAMVDGKPSTFTPTAHTHSASEITNINANEIGANANNITVSGFYHCSSNIPTSDGESDKAVIHNVYGGGSSWATQIAISWRNGRMWFRNKEGGTWEDWHEVYSTNLKPSPTDIGALPLTGGTVSGDINLFAENNDRAIKFDYNGSLAYAWRIAYLGTGSGDANYLVFQSGKAAGSAWNTALRFGLETLKGDFAVVPSVSGTDMVLTNDSRLSDSRPASDVYAWAKAASKPAYTYSEVGAAASGHNHSGVYEPVFSKNTAFNKNFGTAVGTVCQGNDSRLSNARVPVSHAYDDDAFGLGDSDYYGHCKVIDNLTRSSQNDAEALSAYQGYVLKGLVDGKSKLRSIKDWTTYVSTNGSTAVALPTTESVSDRLIGLVLNKSTSSTRPRVVVWIKMSSTSGTTYKHAFNFPTVGDDTSTSSIYSYEGEIYHVSGALYIDDCTRSDVTPGSPASATKVATSSDINIWDIYVLD